MRNKKYYVLVAQAKDPDKLCVALSGILRAESYSDAEIETGHYRNFLNDGVDPDSFFVVVAYHERQIQGHADFDKFRGNHVTKEKYG